MVFKTLVLVLPDTMLPPLTTRDTVAVETPASLATSFTVGTRMLLSENAFVSSRGNLKRASFPNLVVAHRLVSIRQYSLRVPRVQVGGFLLRRPDCVDGPR